MSFNNWQSAFPSVLLPWQNDGYPECTQWLIDNNVPFLDCLPSQSPPGWFYYFRRPADRDAFAAVWHK